MQTLKTAIVVVLLLTVTYSAYIALTAPPPEIDPRLGDLIVGHNIDSEIGIGEIDPGAPEGLAANGSAAAPVDAGAADPAASFPSHYGMPTGNDSATTRRLTDQVQPNAEPTHESRPTDRIAEGGAREFSPLAAPAPQSLPKPDPSAGPAFADPDRQYESTPYANLNLNPEDATLDPSVEHDGAPANKRSNDGGMPTDNDFAFPSDVSSGESEDRPDSKTPREGAASAAVDPQLVNAIATADKQWEDDRLREALTTLSLFYNDPDLSPADREPLQRRLDVLAGEVIYSSRHLLEQPYRVSGGETLETIAATYDVPWELLANINEIKDPAAIVPGQELKIMRGPFRAEVNLERSELTLFLGELYAGRFPITPGSDPAPQPGTYSVEDKQTARTYYASSGRDVPAGDPRNPYGDVWLDLGSQMCIHGSPESAETDGAGCIRLRPADARDVFGILSQGSSVSIMR